MRDNFDNLRWCFHVRRLVAVDEYHAGVFDSSRCSGCQPVPEHVRDLVRTQLTADRARADRLLDLLDGAPIETSHI